MRTFPYKDEIADVLDGEDAFRVAIRGLAALEDAMLKATGAAFPGKVPTELSRLR